MFLPAFCLFSQALIFLTFLQIQASDPGVSHSYKLTQVTLSAHRWREMVSVRHSIINRGQHMGVRETGTEEKTFFNSLKCFQILQFCNKSHLQQGHRLRSQNGFSKLLDGLICDPVEL